MVKTRKNNLEELQKELEEKTKRKEKAKKPKMKISGRGVFELQKIIKKKAELFKKRK